MRLRACQLMSKINTITITLRAISQLKNLRFCHMGRPCLGFLHLILFHFGDVLAFINVMMLKNMKHLVWHHPGIIYQCFSNCYLALSFDVKSRLFMLTSHYCFINRFMKDGFIENIVHDCIVVWNNAANDNNYAITLTYPEYADDGNLELVLNVNSIPIYRLSFNIIPGQIFNLVDEHVLYITRVQGGGKRFELIKRATKDLHDISPPALLLIAVRAIAAALNIAKILGITVRDQATLGQMPIQEHYFSNYDNFWASMGGVKIDERAFLLPAVPERKPLNMISQSHRRRTRIKRQRQDHIMNQLRQTFEQQCLRQRTVLDKTSSPLLPTT